MSAEFPEMAIKIRTGSMPKLMDGLQSESVDRLFGLIGGVDETPDFVFHQIASHQTKVIARRDRSTAGEKQQRSGAGAFAFTAP